MLPPPLLTCTSGVEVGGCADSWGGGPRGTCLGAGTAAMEFRFSKGVQGIRLRV